MQYYTVYFIWKLLNMFRVEPPPIIRSANNCIYSIWCLSHSYCYLLLSWKSWNRSECVVGGLRRPQHTQTGSISSTIAADSSNCVTKTRCCRYSYLRSWWWVGFQSKHVEQFPHKINCVTLHLFGCRVYYNMVRTVLRLAFHVVCKMNSKLKTNTLSSSPLNCLKDLN